MPTKVVSMIGVSNRLTKPDWKISTLGNSVEEHFYDEHKQQAQ